MHKTLFGERCLKWYYNCFLSVLWIPVRPEDFFCKFHYAELYFGHKSPFMPILMSVMVMVIKPWSPALSLACLTVTDIIPTTSLKCYRKDKSIPVNKISPLTKIQFDEKPWNTENGKDSVQTKQCILCSKSVVGWGSRCWDKRHPFTILSCQQPCHKHKSSLDFPVPSEKQVPKLS